MRRIDVSNRVFQLLLVRVFFCLVFCVRVMSVHLRPNDIRSEDCHRGRAVTTGVLAAEEYYVWLWSTQQCISELYSCPVDTTRSRIFLSDFIVFYQLQRPLGKETMGDYEFSAGRCLGGPAQG